MDRWVKRGRILQLRRGVYAIAAPYAKATVHPFQAANALKKASYVSLQSALSHYGMIPEHVPEITSVTTGRPEEIDTPIGRFWFRHVSARFFFGYYELGVASAQTSLIATPQKALLDLLYLTPGSDDDGFLSELRLDFPEDYDFSVLVQMADRSGSPKLRRAAACLIKMYAGG
ncbi:MAG: hypothetical protein R6V03_06620 [Kiritimatiellia bacterium]